MRVFRLVVFLLAIALTLTTVSLSSANAPDVRVADLQCNGDPELVTVENAGDEAQNLSGWQLLSDEPDEVFDLSAVGGLQPDASVLIQAGPSAAGVFRWSADFVFRDDDATDYARIVDNTGATVHQLNCSGGAAATPSPTPATVDGVPNGGGAPPLPDASTTSLAAIAAGAGLAAAGVLLLLLLRLRGRAPAAPAAAVAAPAGAAPPPAPAARQPSRPLPVPVRRVPVADSRAAQAALAVTALGLVVAVAFLLLRARH